MVYCVKLRDLVFCSLCFEEASCHVGGLRIVDACSTIVSLREVDISHPTGHYIRKKYCPLEKILVAPRPNLEVTRMT